MGKLYNLEVGCADASVIESNGNTILVDCHGIEDHSQYLPSNKRLKAVFVTHQHFDHYSGLSYLRSNGYQIENLVVSPYSRRYGDSSVTLDEWNEFNSHKEFFEGRGAKIYMPYRQENFDGAWWNIGGGVKVWVMGPIKEIANSDTRELHDACLVLTIQMNSRTCCFTGDASDASLEQIARKSRNYCNDILHASHHGSMNGANLDFIKGSNAKYTVISTASGRYESVPHPTALQRYKANTQRAIYRTDIHKTIIWEF